MLNQFEEDFNFVHLYSKKIVRKVDSMNYLKEINAFENWLETNYLPSSSQLLWYKLIALFNRCGWKEWISVDNQRLMLLIQVKRKETFINVRDKLIETGLIEYERGAKSKPSRYKLVSLLGKHYLIDDGLNTELNIEPNSGLNTEPNSEPNNGLNTEPNSGTIYKLNKTKLNETKDKDNIKSAHEFDYGAIQKEFERVCVSLPKIKSMTDKRKKAIKSLLSKMSVEDLFLIFKKAQESDFLSGRNGKWTNCCFDWLVNYNNAIKVLENNYKNQKGDNYGINGANKQYTEYESDFTKHAKEAGTDFDKDIDCSF